MTHVALTSLGGVTLGVTPIIKESHNPDDINDLRLNVLRKMTNDRVNIVHDRDTFELAFREFTPKPPGRFKYLVSELYDGSFQLRVSASKDPAGLDWSCQHPSLFLSASLLAESNLPIIFTEKLVGAGFMKLHRGIIYFDGSSGHLSTDDRATSGVDKNERSSFAGLVTISRLMRIIFPDIPLRVKSSAFADVNDYLKSH